ncbi:MAG: nuclear transport factor 2 family protein [Balneolaceae bacterium]
MNRFFKTICAVLSLLLIAPLVAEAQEADVHATIITLFDGMREADGEKFLAQLTPDATLHTVAPQPDGTTERRAADLQQFAAAISQAGEGTLDEVIDSMEIHIDGHLATAWMHYTFIRAGTFSHCGVNTMNLVRSDGDWRIFSIVDTRRTEGCSAAG